jgi:Lon protease-like protein
MSDDARVVPMFPLGTVLFPYALLPLHVFEPRYRLMARHVLDGDNEFGVVLIERGSEVGGGDVRFDTGTMARVVQASELPDGRFALNSVGLHRIRVTRWLPDDPYPKAEIVDIAEPDPEPAAAAARERVIAALAAVVEVARRVDERVPDAPVLDADPVRASYEATAIAPIGPLDAQRILELPEAGARLDALAVLLVERAEELRARFGLD